MVKGKYVFRFGRRLPTYFPNLDLRLMPLTPEQTLQVIKTGWLESAAFRTTPNVNKLEIKEFLESVYGMKVKRVNTMNIEGKTKTRYGRPYKRPDWKKAIVTFFPFSSSPTEKAQETASPSVTSTEDP